MAVINYTSGTTGYSKGVMLPSPQLMVQYSLLPRNAARTNPATISYPCSLWGMFSAWSTIFFTVSRQAHTFISHPHAVAKDYRAVISEIKPRVISCVPLIVEKKIIKKNILPLIDNKIGKLLLRMPIVNDKIKADMRKKAMDVFGGNFDEIIIGGAPFNADVERFLKQIGFPYTIAYGMTECGPIICSSRWETLKLASCGKATTRMEVKIDSPDPQHA
ncbi:MAG: AMP-binding protein [Bacteroides stercoris]